MLEMNPDKVCFVIVKAREFDVADVEVDEDSASNASDDGFTDILEEQEDDPTEQELVDFIEALNEDEQAELVALAWVGRGDYSPEEWSEALESARARHTGPTSAYLLGIPVLADYLEEGLSRFDISCEGFEMGRL